MSNDHVHPFFAGLLADLAGEKKHLKSQTVVKRDVVRFNALHKGWQECGDLISFGTFVAAVDAYERARAEADLEKQYEYERNRNRRKDWWCRCGLSHLPTVPDCPCCGDTRQAELDDRLEQEQIEKRERDAQRVRS